MLYPLKTAAILMLVANSAFAFSTDSAPSGGTGYPESYPEMEPEEAEEAEEGEGGADAAQDSVGYSAASVQGVVSAVEGATSLCTKSGGYSVDCMAERYETMARELGESHRNAEVKEILEDTAAQLRAVARKNQSQTQPPARLRTADGALRTSRPVVPVAPGRQEAAAEEAIAIISEAQTKLLRSAEGDNRVIYAQIASAMESNKVLLRSS